MYFKSLILLSGKGESNPRPSAWEADALPLSYSRIYAVKIVKIFCFNTTEKKESVSQIPS